MKLLAFLVGFTVVVLIFVMIVATKWFLTLASGDPNRTASEALNETLAHQREVLLNALQLTAEFILLMIIASMYKLERKQGNDKNADESHKVRCVLRWYSPTAWIVALIFITKACVIAAIDEVKQQYAESWVEISWDWSKDKKVSKITKSFVRYKTLMTRQF